MRSPKSLPVIFLLMSTGGICANAGAHETRQPCEEIASPVIVWQPGLLIKMSELTYLVKQVEPMAERFAPPASNPVLRVTLVEVALRNADLFVNIQAEQEFFIGGPQRFMAPEFKLLSGPLHNPQLILNAELQIQNDRRPTLAAEIARLQLFHALAGKEPYQPTPPVHP